MYSELTQNLDTIIHNGALVNHAFTYEQLFEPNVLGSLEVDIACKIVTCMSLSWTRGWELDGQLHALYATLTSALLYPLLDPPLGYLQSARACCGCLTPCKL